MNIPSTSAPPGFAALTERRSVRTFTATPVPQQVRQALLQAAAQAPSAHGARPIRFWVLDDLEIRRRLVAALPWFQALDTAGFAVMVLADPRVCVQSEYWPVDGAAATQNLLTAGQLWGLGSVWLGITPVENNVRAVKEVVVLPEGLEPVSIVALGFPAQRPAARAPYDLGPLLVEGRRR